MQNKIMGGASKRHSLVSSPLLHVCNMEVPFVPDLVGEQQGILCCQCGIPIQPNPANMCVGCLRTQVDITEGIPKQSTVYFCNKCERYLQPPSNWVQCSLESRELLALCLKRLKGLSKVHLVDASFVWTEPHSKRLKIKLTIQKEVLASTLLQQVFIVEYVVHNQICDDCQRIEAKDYWRSLVQVRQKTSHKKTFLYLEQLILKHNAHGSVLRIKERPGGLDFYYGQKQDARKLVDFIMSVVPSKYKTSQELISHDVHSNTYNYKFTFAVEIVPVCKDNIVCLPRKLAQSLGNISPIVHCSKVTSYLQVIDPMTLQVADISANVYWRTPFIPLFDHRQFVQFLVLQCDVVSTLPVAHNISGKYVLSEVWVCPLNEMDRHVYTRTHLGHFLNPGDVVWGVDFARSNLNDEHFDKLKTSDVPEVVLIKKCYGDRKNRHKKRMWQLKSLPKEVEDISMDEEDNEKDFLDFLEDLEEDKAFREGVNIYRNPKPLAAALDESDHEEYPQIGVEEMLQNLTLSNY